MNRIPVRSSNIVSVGWNNNILEIQFHNGAVYQYAEVPKKVADEMLRAKSIGSYFRHSIEPFAKYQRLK